MKKKRLILVLAIFSLNMMSCSGKEKSKMYEKVKEEEMIIDEKALEEEFDKLDDDVEKIDSLNKKAEATKKSSLEQKIQEGKKVVEEKVEIKVN